MMPELSAGERQVAEPGLVRDVLSACQGISSGTVTCSLDAAGEQHFTVSERLSPPQRQLIARHCEYGWLFRYDRLSPAYCCTDAMCMTLVRLQVAEWLPDCTRASPSSML